MTLISFSEVHFAYRGHADRPILGGASLSLEVEDRVALDGANGCGKSTVLRLLMGLERPDSGTIHYDGEDVAAGAVLRRLRREVGLVFQHADDQLFSPTVIDDVAFGPLNLGLEVPAARERARWALAAVGLDGFEERITYRLSGGEKRLVALATVLAMEPRFLLLDEPTAGLDGAARQHILAALAGRTGLLVVSHDPEVQATLATRVVRLTDGHIENG